MGIHSFATHSEYFKTSQQTFQYIKSNLGVKDITDHGHFSEREWLYSQNYNFKNHKTAHT